MATEDFTLPENHDAKGLDQDLRGLSLSVTYEGLSIVGNIVTVSTDSALSASDEEAVSDAINNHHVSFLTHAIRKYTGDADVRLFERSVFVITADAKANLPEYPKADDVIIIANDPESSASAKLTVDGGTVDI